MKQEPINMHTKPNDAETLSTTRKLPSRGAAQQLLHGTLPRTSRQGNAGDWDFRGTNTQYSTHGMHTWLAAMIPGVAQKLISKTNARKVLDPFCGGGTVLVECVHNGVPSAGVDINPLAVIISNAKTTPISANDLHEELA